MKAMAFLLLALALAAGCAQQPQLIGGNMFKSDLDVLEKHTDVIVLSDDQQQAQVAIVPRFQGRVMTSTATGPDGLSFGWINRGLIASEQLQPHINAFGGEDRFWLGPEGGQFSIFFAPGSTFDLAHWQTPAALDTQPFELLGHTHDQAQFRKRFDLTNYSGARFSLQVDRGIRLLNAPMVWKQLNVDAVKDVKVVGFESINRVTNVGQSAWKKDTGLLSIWILGMFNASPGATVVVPLKPRQSSWTGSPVNTDYFGEIPADRLKVDDHVAFFKADGDFRSKIGVPWNKARPVLGSYDPTNHVLTIVQYTLPEQPMPYVDSRWKQQDQPYAGDVVNSYNDGPAAPEGTQLGKFYELESSSPAAELAPGEVLEHTHRTIHLVGQEKDLDPIARATLGVSLDQIKTALPR